MPAAENRSAPLSELRELLSSLRGDTLRGGKLLFIVIVALILGATASAQNVTGTIGVGNGPAASATNPLTNTIYVLNSSDGTVSVINGATGQVIGSAITVGSDPVALAVDPVTNTIYVANKGSADVTPINGATNTAGSAIAVGTNPTAIAVNPVSDTIYVANNGSNNVTPINGATNTAGSAIAVGTNPAAIAVNSVTNTIYVANYGSNTVTPINGATNTAASAIAVGTNPTAIAVNPATNIIYVANNGSADVTPINGATNTSGSAIAVGTNPTAIAVNPVSNTIYVANNGSGNVTAINGTNNIPVTVTDASASAPIAVALNLTTNTVYVANNGSANVTAINGATNLVVASLAAGTDPVAIAVNPVTGMAYVANAGSASVAMISNATYANSSISDSSFASPNAIEVNPVTNEVYVANNGSSGSDTITVINPANNNSVSTVTDSSAIAPTAIAVNPATNMIYIADRTSRTVTVINAGNGNQVTTITPPGAAQPVAIAVNPVNNIIYVANSATNNVTMINAANSNHVSVISDPYALGPAAVAVNSVTGQVYVANSGSNSVSVFDGVTGLYVASIAAGVFPQAVAVNPVTNTVYVANSESSNVTVINGATNLVTATVGVPNSPVAVAVNPATNQIYVADASNETGDVTVINGATNATTTITSASLLSPNAIAVNPTTNKIYVADYDGYVTAIDGVTNTPVAVTDTNAQGPFAVAVNPVTNDAYLANDVSDNATAVAEQQVESNALQTAITPLANNATSSETPSFSFTATNGLTGAAPDNLVYQFDSWTGPWTVAVRDTSPGAFSATVATPLEPGFHTIFAFATDGEDGTSVNTGAQSSPLIGMIAAYGFLVAPQIATAFPPALTFASQTQSTSSAPQTAYLANEGEVALAFTYGFSGTNGTDFTEGSGDTCSTQGGTLAAGASCTVSVVFTPSTTSSETASLVFTDNSNGIPESTQAVALSGTGSAIPSYTLNIGESGTGSGAVTSNPTGIACQPTCSASYPSGTQIKLTAAPGTGSAFVQWSGACTGATTTCTFTITANSTVTATFSLTAATACTGTTTNWTGGASGNWSNASNWSTGVVPNSASVVVCINNGASPSSAVVLDTSVSVGGLYIDPGSSLTIGDNITLVVSGTVSNSGQIIISSAADNSNLQINHTVTLTGGGTISMTETGAGGVPTLENYSFGNLTNVNNVIQGAGQIVNNSGWSFTNGPAGVINASSGNIFINEPMTNQGLMESTSTGVLQITINVINQLANIEAIGGSATVEFSVNADIQGGTLRTSGGGTMETLPSQTATLDGSTYGTLTIVGTYTGQDNSTTILAGTINNTGTILLSAAADNVNLQINHTVTLTGGGTVMLSKSAAGQPTLENYSFGNLANVNNLIQGAGQIVNNSGWSFTNGPAGIINANQANGTLVISEPMTNQGLMEATGSSSALEIEVTITNPNANIKAIGSTAAVEFNVNANIQGGTLTTSGGGTIETLQNQTTTLDGSTYGTLTIVGTYTGQDNSTTIVAGTINNTGTILLAAIADNVNLQINHTVTLTGGGTILMTETGAGVPTLENYSFGNLTSVNNVIQGAGQIVNNSGWSFTNAPAGVINANSGKIFINEPMTNQGLMEATSTGVLQITIDVINQLANIEAIGGSAAVEFSVNADIQGGTLTTSGGGTMETLQNQTTTLDGSTYGALTIVGTYTGQDNSTTILAGTINNTGTILLAAVADNVNLQINHNVTLTDGGTILMTETGAGVPTLENYSFGNLTNVNNVIQGAGQIVNNSGWSFTNAPAGVIDANSGNFFITEPMTNQGLMEATSTGVLQITIDVINQSANIEAIGGSATVEFSVNADIQGGTLRTSGGGTMETLQNQTTTLDGSTYGTLTIVGTYTGQDNSTTIATGTINNTGTMLFAAVADNVNLQINHTVTLTGGGTVMLSKSGAGQPTLENYSFGNLTNVNNVIQGAGQVVNNSGWSFTNAPAGVIDASGGNIFINEPMTNQGLMEATSSGVLQIAVSISNAGEIVPDSSPDPGTISITGNLTESAAGAEGVFLGGLTAGTQYSQLNVSGTASLSGALDVAFINGFTPALGNQFTVLTASSVTGTFSSINSAALPQGVIWTLTYNPPSNPTSVVLAAVQGTSTSQTLTVADLGAGSGSVTDNLGQINCIDTAGVQSGTCSASYNTGTAVTLSATPVSPATFGGWGGACSGTGGCSVVMNSAQSVTASFVPVTSTSQTLTVADLGTGGGSVTDNLGQINCIDTAGVQSGTCSASYNTGTLVTLSATPVSPATFGGWGGACSGTGGCSVVMNSAQSVTASFVPQPPTAPVPFSCPGGVYPCSNVTSPPAVFNCPSGTNPCTDANAHSLTFTAAQVNSPFTLTVEANEVPASQSNGDCPSGQTPSTYFACRFTSFFAYETLPNGDTIVPACDAYSNGNCVFYSIYYGTKGNEPPEGDFSGPIGWSIAWNNTSYPPPSGYPYQANNPRLYYDPDYEVSATTPYGTDCSVAMDINGAPTEPPIYCQFVFDITTYYDPTQPPDAGIGGKSKQFSDVVVAFPLSIAGPNLSVTKTADQTQVTAGSAIGYTITMSNSSAPGTGSATNATLNDPLPAGSGVNWSIAPAYSGQGTCTIAGAPPSQTLSCALGNLSPAISSSVHVSSSSSSAGTYNNTATFSAVNNAPQTSSASIQVVQESGGSVAFTPPSIDFETVYLGGAKLKKQVTMKNTGTSLLTISNISLAPAAGTGPDDFSFRSYCPLKLAAGKSCTIALFFSADAVGTPSAMLSVTDNVAGSPQQVSLSATVIDPQASFSPTNLSFKKLQVGSSSTQSLTLTNTGTTALNIASISVTGAEQGDFAESNDCPSVLAASTPCNISITFTPSATGFRSAKLRVVDNTEAGKQNVTLTGLGSE